jgi:NAD(P)-dependent dehydrogenase (short-subunit alcohol dehydrogenase family)
VLVNNAVSLDVEPPDAKVDRLATSTWEHIFRIGIRCNTLAPGDIVNEDREVLSEARRAHFEAMHLTRLPVADDIAASAAYLASRDAEVVTGILLPVDGGSSTAARAASFG